MRFIQYRYHRASMETKATVFCERSTERGWFAYVKHLYIRFFLRTSFPQKSNHKKTCTLHLLTKRIFQLEWNCRERKSWSISKIMQMLYIISIFRNISIRYRCTKLWVENLNTISHIIPKCTFQVYTFQIITCQNTLKMKLESFW